MTTKPRAKSPKARKALKNKIQTSPDVTEFRLCKPFKSFIELDKGGKKPVFKDWPDRNCDHNRATAHMKAGRNIGIKCEHVIGVDYDAARDDLSDNVKNNSWARLMRQAKVNTKDLCIIKTGNLDNPLNRHFYFKKPDDFDHDKRYRQQLNDEFPGIEFKTHKGGQMVAPGSLHPTGGIYRIHSDGVDPFSMPEATKHLLAIFERQVPNGSSMGSGERRWGTFDPKQIKDVLEFCDPKQFGKGHNDNYVALLASVAFMTGHDPEALLVIQEFLAQDDDYGTSGDYAANERRWDSFTYDHTSPAAAGTFFKLMEDMNIPKLYWPNNRIEAYWEDEDLDSIYRDDILRDPQAEISSENIDPVTRVVKTMNQDFFIATQNDQTFIFKETLKDSGQMAISSGASKNGWKDWFANRKTDVVVATQSAMTGKTIERIETKTHLDIWLESPLRREYSDIIFEPDSNREVSQPDGTKAYNAWPGWGVMDDTSKATTCDKFKELVWKVIAGRDAENYEYIMNYLAYSIQHAARPQGVVMVVKSRYKGIGKSVFARIWRELFGIAGSVTQNEETILGQFTGDLDRICALHLEESVFAGHKKAYAKMKALITEPVITVEQKYKKARMANNHLTIIMTTNDEWAVPADAEERRYAVFECMNDPSLVGGTFFKDLFEEMRNGGYQALFQKLKTRNINGFGPQKDIPQNRALLSQKQITMGPIAEFWTMMLNKGEWPLQFPQSIRKGIRESERTWDNNTIRVPHDIVRDAFKLFLEDRNMLKSRNFPSNYVYELDNKLRSLVPMGYQPRRALAVVSKEMIKETELFDLTYQNGGKRVICYEFPSLRKCQITAEKIYGYTPDVDDDLDDDDEMWT